MTKRIVAVFICHIFILTHCISDVMSQERKYVVCPICMQVNPYKTEGGVKHITCYNRRCKSKLDINKLEVFSVRKKAAELKFAMRRERIKRMKKYGIDFGSIIVVRCAKCGQKKHLTAFDVLNMVESRESRFITCSIRSCKYSYDVSDGMKCYYANKQKDHQDAVTFGILGGLTLGIIGAAISGDSAGGPAYIPPSPNSVYIPGYYRSDGTYVRLHYRSWADNVLWNNYGPSQTQAELLYPTQRDYDNDGIPNYLDIDDDNDGIIDDLDMSQYNASVW